MHIKLLRLEKFRKYDEIYKTTRQFISRHPRKKAFQVHKDICTIDWRVAKIIFEVKTTYKLRK